MSTLLSEYKKTAYILQIFFELFAYFTVIFVLSMMFLQRWISYFYNFPEALNLIFLYNVTKPDSH